LIFLASDLWTFIAKYSDFQIFILQLDDLVKGQGRVNYYMT